jgi:hypothetical protein
MESTLLNAISMGSEEPSKPLGGMRKSPSLWKLSSLAQLCDDDAVSVTDSEEDDMESVGKRKPALSVWMQKPPRHKSMPICMQAVLNVWKRVLRRSDISVKSDFFNDLDGMDEQAWEVVEQMQAVGVSISLQQFYALRRCCVYSVIMAVL